MTIIIGTAGDRPDDTLRGIINAKLLSKEGNAVLTKAHRAVRHTAKKIAMFRDLVKQT